MHGASTAYHEPAVSDHMETFTGDVYCLLDRWTLTHALVSYPDLGRKLGMLRYGRRVKDARNTAPTTPPLKAIQFILGNQYPIMISKRDKFS